MKIKINVPYSNVFDFVSELKALLLKHGVGQFKCGFKLLIEEHSISLPREYSYLHPKQNDDHELSELVLLSKKVI